MSLSNSELHENRSGEKQTLLRGGNSCYLRFSAFLRSLEWKFRTDVSGQPIHSIFKDIKFQMLSRNVGMKLPLNPA
jgi:hypothetical protein